MEESAGKDLVYVVNKDKDLFVPLLTEAPFLCKEVYGKPSLQV